MKTLMLMIAVCAGLAFAGCGGDDSSSDSTVAAGTAAAETTEDEPGPEVEVPEGPPPKKLIIKDLKVGSGKEAKEGDEVKVQYVTVRWDGGSYSNSYTYRGAPSFVLGSGQLIPGFDQGIRGMKEGGRRELIVPTRLVVFPDDPRPNRLNPNRDSLVFVVDLLKVN